ncbi:NADH-dependent flavin oxidoreductase nadA [Fusarium oxysporum f. sp. albedinis]|nr:NADH-dependent flavin oxidoreductase nadA [Fusarium oxysporum f. sp. albedinis]
MTICVGFCSLDAGVKPRVACMLGGLSLVDPARWSGRLPMADALGAVSSVIAVVDLSAKVIKWCVRYAQDVSHAKDDKKRLAEEVTRLNLASVNARKLLDGPHGSRLKASHALYLATVNSQSQLRRIESQLVRGSGQANVNIEALKWPFKSKDIQSVIQDVHRCTKAIYSALEVDQTLVSILLDIDHKIALDTLPVAEGALFDSHAEEHNPTCLPNTRQELLDDIGHWIDDSNSKTVYWLNGMAGTGKSTIARTIAHSRSQRGDLGASFFFKRGEMDRGSLNKLMSTLAHQLALSIPGIALLIKKTLDANPAIVGKSIKEQFEKLIQEPLSKAAATVTTPSSVVMVIDALDECDQEADIRLLINIFSQAKTLRPRLRVFLTSRPELPIRLGFSEVQGSYQDLVLHKIPAEIVEHDIIVFLNDEFKKIRHDFNLTVGNERKLPPDWPGRPTVQSLAQMAVPLFIFAATVCRFIGDRKRDSPTIQLRKVLDYEGKGHVSQLDRTYGPVLRSLVTDVSENDKTQTINDFKMIVGSIVILANPLSVWALSQLLEVNPEVVDHRLDTLHSVLSIPLGRTLPVRLLHLSFRDYLIAEKSEFQVDERLTHRNLAKHCLRVMRAALRENICGLSFPGMRRSAVGTAQLEEHIPRELQYACMYWVHHQAKADLEPNDSHEIFEFLTTHFLHWVEVLSLLGRVADGLNSNRSLVDWLENRGDSGLSDFLADAVRFLQANFSVINKAPLQIYSSALAFAPKTSIIRNRFKHCIPEWLTIWPQVKEDWDACLLALEGHSSSVISAVFSHDSTVMVSASDDETVRIWDVKTGKCEHVLAGHSSLVNSVSFSHGSTMVASASDDETVRIWDVKMGKCQHVLEGHNDLVYAVSFSHDSTMVASASYDKTVRIWDVKTGKCEHVLEGHSDLVYSVSFSHDSTMVASASWDTAVRIWDAKTGKCEHILKGHSHGVNCMMFSHESTMVASASPDKTVRIWDVKTGKCEHVLEGHCGYVNSAVFSHDSTMVASASDDKTVRIWNVKTGKCEHVLVGHSSLVNSVSFSHGSTMVASASDDETVRIWDVKVGKSEHVLEGHSEEVKSVSFSHGSTMVASASPDKTVRIWDVKTGKCEHVLEGHNDLVYSVSFSHDSTMVASASYDKTVRIWDLKTGKCEHVEGHSSWVKSVSFSHDSTTAASASWDQTVRIWDAKTGKCERVLEGHGHWVNSAVFSHDSTMVASASNDKTVRIWDLETGKCEHVLVGHNDLVYSVVFSHDSTMVASASDDKTVRIWDVKTGACREVMPLDSYTNELSFTPDECGVVTSDGVSAFTGDLVFSAGPPMPSQPSMFSTLGLQDETWVTTAGKDLLWLPTECRGGTADISADTVVIGCGSGRVIVLGFSAAEIAKL